MYTLKVAHSQIHLLSAAVDLANAILVNDEALAVTKARVFKAFAIISPERNLSLMKLRRELVRLHTDAIEIDGQGDEFDSSPLVGAALGDMRDERRQLLADMDAEIARHAEAPAETQGSDFDLGAGDAGSKWS